MVDSRWTLTWCDILLEVGSGIVYPITRSEWQRPPWALAAEAAAPGPGCAATTGALAEGLVGRTARKCVALPAYHLLHAPQPLL